MTVCNSSLFARFTNYVGKLGMVIIAYRVFQSLLYNLHYDRYHYPENIFLIVKGQLWAAKRLLFNRFSKIMFMGLKVLLPNFETFGLYHNDTFYILKGVFTLYRFTS